VTTQDPFDLSADELKRLLHTAAPLLPELESARANLAALRDAPQTRLALEQTDPLMSWIAPIPVTPYTAFRLFRRTGDRQQYERPYFLKRENLSAVALRLFLGEAGYKDLVQDYLWNICEESTWVLPAHEREGIDLFSAETAFVLAETLALLGEALDDEVRHRVREEVERRVFDPYLRWHHTYYWYKRAGNWNGVCNSSVAAAFLLLEPEPARVARAVEIALAGLHAFVDTAFEPDGASTEGVAYWHYGLMNFVALAEMLYARSGGAIDLLGTERMRRIAAYPAKLLLSGSTFASFSDCDESVEFNPGILARLALRTGETSLLDLLAEPAKLVSDWRLTMNLRNVLWWDGSRRAAPQLADAVLPSAGVARLYARAARTNNDAPVVLAIKAGHNDEKHNQNDVASFIVHVDGENFLTDPGPGLYSRQYFSETRYDNVFAGSYGHSVPRIDGMQQQAGSQFRGELLGVDTQGAVKCARLEFGRAYPVERLASAVREVILAPGGERAGTVWLQDDFRFDGEPGHVEEAFVTWLEVGVEGATAVLFGKNQRMVLVIEQPAGAHFALEMLQEASKANDKPGVLKRLSFALPPGLEQQARVRIEVV
jgi:hypothetical protein